MSQVDQVRAHLLAGKSITPASAIAVYGIFRLSSVVEDLRQSGLEVDCVLKYDEVGKQYGEYSLRRPIGVGSKVQVRRGHGIGLPQWVRKLRAAAVIATHGDVALVRFVCGQNMRDVWCNQQELVNAS